MREESIISYDTAKLANEKGYPIYNNFAKSNFYNRRTKSLIYFGRTGNQTKQHLYGAPTQSLLQKWLREVKKLSIKVDDFYTDADIRFDFSISVLGSQDDNPQGIFNTYEEALEAGLVEALNFKFKIK